MGRWENIDSSGSTGDREEGVCMDKSDKAEDTFVDFLVMQTVRREASIEI